MVEVLGPATEVTFVPVDPPRASWFALWEPDAPVGLLADEVDEPRVDIELSVAVDGGTRKRSVGARQMAMADAIATLGALPAAAEVTTSALAWAATVRAALDLIGRGRLLPSVSDDGWDAWRVDPLDPGDGEHLGALAAALPATAHCVATGGRGRIVAPGVAIRSCVDAVGDRMVRTAAASVTTSSPLYGDLAHTRVRHLRPWARDLVSAHCAGAVLVLRIQPPPDLDDLEATWSVRIQLRSHEDPSLVVDAGDLWRSPAEVLARLGERAETDLLAGLRRAAGVFAPLGRALDEATPDEVELDDAEVDLLLDQLDALSDLGIEARWPADLVAPKLERRVVVSATAPDDSLPSVTDLESLLRVDWELLLDGVALTPAELAALGKAKRAVIPLRGRWVRLDRSARDKLRARPPRIHAADALAAALGAGLALDLDDALDDPDELVEVRVEGAFAELAARLSGLDGARDESEPAGLDATLRPYQRRGLAWMADLSAIGLGGCLADDMGLGKTVQVLALHALRGGPTLVVCPTSLLANWEREAERFVPDATVHRYHGGGRELGEPGPGDLVVTTYGVVRSDADTLAATAWDVVIADEAQAVKNPRSRSARALRTVPGRSRIALTGTPVENRLSELWSILDWAVPGLLGPLETFRRTTAVPIERDGDAEATDRLARLIRPFLLRRRKTDPGIAPELPPKTEHDLVVPLTAEQVTLYRAAVDEALADVAENEGIARQGMVLKMLTALKQITNHPAQFLGEPGPLADRSGKLAALDELLDLAIDAGESTLVFSQYVAMGRLLVEHQRSRGLHAELLHGGLSVTARQELVDRFQAGELSVLFLSLKAGGTGLNLTAATQVVHYDRWWNPAVEDQATDRAYRIGQDRPVTVHRLITEGTVEDRVGQLLANKRRLADAVVGSGEGWLGDLDDDELADLVRLREPS